MNGQALKLGLIVTLVVASVAAPLMIWHHAQVQGRKQDESLRQQAERLADLSAESQRLSNLVNQAASFSLPSNQLSELLKLRGEVGQLRRIVGEMDSLRAKNQQLLGTRRTSEEQSRAPSPPEQESSP